VGQPCFYTRSLDITSVQNSTQTETPTSSTVICYIFTRTQQRVFHLRSASSIFHNQGYAKIKLF